MYDKMFLCFRVAMVGEHVRSSRSVANRVMAQGSRLRYQVGAVHLILVDNLAVFKCAIQILLHDCPGHHAIAG